MPPPLRAALALVCALALACPVAAAASQPDLRIAVAANFKTTLTELLKTFNQATNTRVHVSAGSTGALYAQIGKGAPFDVLMAADTLRPTLLQEERRTIPGTRFTYALGSLVLWIPEANQVNVAHLEESDFPLAVANPRHAPYGQAAMQVINRARSTEISLATGTNVSQAANFVATGNARGGFVALSQMVALKVPPEQYWLVPQYLHDPIEQQVVALKGASPAYRDFLRFLRSDAARRIITRAGYRLGPAGAPPGGSNLALTNESSEEGGTADLAPDRQDQAPGSRPASETSPP